MSNLLLKFNKDRSMCRNCDCHHQYIDNDVVEIPCIYCSYYSSGACFNYVPMDNLEMLEMKYEQSLKLG
jgi:hypothetical protein